MSIQTKLAEYLKRIEKVGCEKTLCELGDTTTESWEHCSGPLECGLETWMLSLSEFGRPTYSKAAAVAGRMTYPVALQRGGDMAEIFQENSPSLDGAPAGMQIRLVENWLENPTNENLELVKEGSDPSRQLNIWDEDLYPSDDMMWMWFLEVGQLTTYSVVADEDIKSRPTKEPNTWPPSLCAARSVVCAAKTLRLPGGNPLHDITSLIENICKVIKSQTD